MKCNDQNYELMRVQFISSKAIRQYGTVQLRCIQPAEYLSKRGWSVEVGNIREIEPVRSGIIFLHRTPLNKFTTAFARYARNLGNILIYDTDDLTFDGRSGQAGIWKLCDEVTVSTEYLRNQFGDFHHNVQVVKNALSLNYLSSAETVYKNRTARGKKDSDESVTIGYLSGSSTHDKDFRIVQSTLLWLLKKYSSTRILLAGKLNFSGEFLEFGDRFEYRPFMSYDEYVRIYEKVDINLAPLELHSNFCHGKSELKYIEAGACGVPTIASPTATYKLIIKDGHNGFLAEDNEWKSKIEALVNNECLRYDVGLCAREKVCEDYHPSLRGEELEHLLKKIIGRYHKTESLLMAAFYVRLSNFWKHRALPKTI